MGKNPADRPVVAKVLPEIPVPLNVPPAGLPVRMMSCPLPRQTDPPKVGEMLTAVGWLTLTIPRLFTLNGTRPWNWSLNTELLLNRTVSLLVALNFSVKRLVPLLKLKGFKPNQLTLIALPDTEVADILAPRFPLTDSRPTKVMVVPWVKVRSNKPIWLKSLTVTGMRTIAVLPAQN